MRFMILVVLAMSVSTARAQSGEDKAVAETLFQDGRTLAAAGRYAEGCPKFEASLRLDPGVGTELNLADCYEHLGRFASAWGMFKQAADDARKIADADAEQAARDRAAVLEPKLSRLTIQLPKETIVGLAVTRNGVTVELTVLGTAMPVDPGAQKIECRAPGRKGWTQELAVQPGASVVAAVPNLAVDTTTVTGGASALQITVGEQAEQYEIEVATTGGPLRCEGQVTRDHPCTLKAPAGPAVISVRGAASLSEDLKLSGKPVLVSVEKTGRYLLYGGAVTAGVAAVSLGIGLYACSNRDANDIKNGTATGLTCVGGTTLGGVGLVAGGAMMIWDLFTEHHVLDVHTEGDDDEDVDNVGVRGVYTTPAAGGAVVGITGSF
jgi:hypothetical protein